LVWLEVLRHLYLNNFNGNKKPVTPNSCCCSFDDRRPKQIGLRITSNSQLPENMPNRDSATATDYALYKPYTGYMGHNIVALAVHWPSQQVIDFAFNHNSAFNSPAEHAEMRLLDRIFRSRSHVSVDWLDGKQLKNVHGKAQKGARKWWRDRMTVAHGSVSRFA